MKIFVCIFFLAAIAPAGLRAGTIVGTVRAEGKADANADSADGKYTSRKYKFAEKVNYQEMRDFVVYVEGPVGTNTVVAPSQPVVVSTSRVMQQGAMFSPHVLPIVVGTTVQWPNNDEIYHNVFSMSD